MAGHPQLVPSVQFQPSRDDSMISNNAATSPANNAVHDQESTKLLVPPGNDATLAQQFSYFPRLPLERRREIWSQAPPGPRVIEIYKKKLQVHRLIRKDTHLSLFNLKNACKGSQEVVLGKYEEIPARAWELDALPL
jgi:hypothetical protein